jgi:uncharacterized protein (DUF697 family)
MKEPSIGEKLSSKLASYLEGAFDSVALTRKQHFKEARRPNPDDIDSIITMYANQNALVAGAANLIPGPFGALAILPEITAIIRNQIQMVYDIGVAHGKDEHLDGNLLLVIFTTVTGGGAISLATVKGGQLIVRRASLQVIQKLVVWLGGKITQRALKALLSKWVPVVGAAAMALWARQTTVAMGQKAAEMFEKEVVIE